MFKLGAVLRLFHTASLHVVLFRRQRSAGMWQLEFNGPCPSMLWEIYLVLREKTILCFFSVGSFQSPYHTV